tara:strand:- start:11 stop:721 length:711 start_codon:yes stop_codon:yes gene_type:complete
MNNRKIIVLAIITARKNSKGIKNKNIKKLNNKPLIQYTFESANNSKLITDIIVSTDSNKIIELSKKFGIEAPFKRPANLSTSKASSLDVIDHALNWFEKNKKTKVDYIVLLQPTSPLRSNDHIDQSIKKILKEKYSHSLISCYDASHVHPSIMYSQKNDKLIKYEKEKSNKRRQDFKKLFIRNGAIYVVKRDYFKQEKQIICNNPILYKMKRDESINIDESIDFDIAELILKKNEI